MTHSITSGRSVICPTRQGCQVCDTHTHTHITLDHGMQIELDPVSQAPGHGKNHATAYGMVAHRAPLSRAIGGSAIRTSIRGVS